jgi:hypothetical protein
MRGHGIRQRERELASVGFRAAAELGQDRWVCWPRQERIKLGSGLAAVQRTHCYLREARGLRIKAKRRSEDGLLRQCRVRLEPDTRKQEDRP